MSVFLLVIIYITFISLGLPDSLLGSVWPVMRADFNASLDSAGIISFVTVAGTVLSSLVSDKVISKFGTGKTTAFSVFLTAAALLGFSVSQSFWVLIVLAVPLGIGAGAIDAALNNYVALNYKAHHMNWLHCFWGVGALASPLVLSSFIRGGNWRGGYLSIGIVQSAIFLLLLFTLPLWKREKTAIQKADQAEAATSLTIAEAFKTRGVTVSTIVFALYCGTECIVGLWCSSFLVRLHSFSAENAAAAASLYYGGIAAGRAVSGLISGKISSKQLIRIGLILILPGVVLLLLPLPPAGCCAALFIIGLACAPVFPGMIHETPTRFGAAKSQKIIGLQMASAYTGCSLLPPLVGFIADKTTMFIIPLTLTVFAVCMIFGNEYLNATLKTNSKEK